MFTCAWARNSPLGIASDEKDPTRQILFQLVTEGVGGLIASQFTSLPKIERLEFMSDLTMCRLVASAQSSSQSTMLTILWALLSFALPVLGPHIPVSCPVAKRCSLALLSNNDVLLECAVSDTQWLFSEPNGDGKPINLFSVPNLRKSPEGGLRIQNPSPYNTGLYQCQDKNGTQVTSYKIDFQDITRLHATHKNLNQQPLMNETLNLGHKEVVYTQWEPWQRCGNCGRPGERKRLGYCYIKEPLEEPVPCGLYLGGTNVFHDRIRPEMQVEICHVTCRGHLTGGDYIIFNNFRLMEFQSLWLTCPLASIYR